MQSILDETEIRSAERALQNALESPDATAWVYHYTEDAVFVGPGAPAVEGREALLAMVKAMQPLSSVSIVPLRTEGSGSIAYTYAEGSWVNGRPPHTGTTTHVRLVIVWRKEEDGVWRVTQELLNAAPAA
jgi:uncharacterized protein (TIGR02246 family)